MTNTRITDPETIEKRYPCILHEFSIRKGSGGRGRFNGGDGCIRDIEFRVPVELSVLTERRTVAPYGMCGGGPGACGENIWVKHDQSTGKVREISLGGKNTCNMAAGDRIIIRKSTPTHTGRFNVHVYGEQVLTASRKSRRRRLRGGLIIQMWQIITTVTCYIVIYPHHHCNLHTYHHRPVSLDCCGVSITIGSLV